MPSYPSGVVPGEYRGRLLIRETQAGARIIRSWVYATPNRGFVRRILGHLSFTALSLMLAPLAGHQDIVFVESPPLFHGVSGALIARLLRARFVFNISDLWLESAIDMGIVRHQALIGLTRLMQNWIYRQADAITAVTRGIVARLEADPAVRCPVHLLTNGVDAAIFAHTESGRTTVRAEIGLGETFVALYAGTHGLAHGLDSILDAAKLLRERDDIRIVLAGDGAERARLFARARAESIENVIFLPNQPKERMPALLSAADACLVPLRDLPIFRGALPSKMFEAMSIGCPLILSVVGEAAELVTAAECGIVVPPEDASAIAKAITQLADDRELGAKLGAAGRAYVSRHFSREAIVDRSERIFAETLART